MLFKLPDSAPRVAGHCTATSKNVKPSKQQKMNPIKFCFILSVMFGATPFLVVLEASQASQVQPPTKTFQARITVHETYKAGYSNSNSAEFKTFGTQFCKRVGEYLDKKLAGYRGCEVKKLTSGSVIADTAIVFEESSDVTPRLVTQALKDAVNLGNVTLVVETTSSIPQRIK